jgi:hypothetical protein
MINTTEIQSNWTGEQKKSLFTPPAPGDRLDSFDNFGVLVSDSVDQSLANASAGLAEATGRFAFNKASEANNITDMARGLTLQVIGKTVMSKMMYGTFLNKQARKEFFMKELNFSGKHMINNWSEKADKIAEGPKVLKKEVPFKEGDAARMTLNIESGKQIGNIKEAVKLSLVFDGNDEFHTDRLDSSVFYDPTSANNELRFFTQKYINWVSGGSVGEEPARYVDKDGENYALYVGVIQRLSKEEDVKLVDAYGKMLVSSSTTF